MFILGAGPMSSKTGANSSQDTMHRKLARVVSSMGLRRVSEILPPEKRMMRMLKASRRFICLRHTLNAHLKLYPYSKPGISSKNLSIPQGMLSALPVKQKRLLATRLLGLVISRVNQYHWFLV